ncbi:hypothetical protein [Bacillus methanolicus]|uniref:hypothetical protein n=1 Tax=Bacillus methanolicus TaxID=1471 RepID=UPI00200FE9AF|nr:hypothetical protein [Bacillus methanolicus]
MKESPKSDNLNCSLKTEQTKASTFKSGGDRLASKEAGASGGKVLKDFDRRSEVAEKLGAETG